MAREMGFLLLGAGRGGTSLLAGLLDAHPRIAVGFEYKAVACLMGERVAERGARLFDARVGAFREACRKRARRFPDALWGNKITTEQLLALEDHNRCNPAAPVDRLERFFNAELAGVPVVFVLRDGRTCVRSKMKRAGRSLTEACDLWRESVRVWRFLRDHHAPNLRLRYEDLVLQPRETLDEVCAFLGVPFEPCMIAGTRSPSMPEAYRRDGLDAAPLALEGTEEVGDRIAPELRECGYLPAPRPAT